MRISDWSSDVCSSDLKMREWMLNSAIATNEDIEEIEKSVRQSVKQAQKEAWDEYIEPVKKDVKAISALLKEIGEKDTATSKILQEFAGTVDPLYRDVVHAVRRPLAVTAGKEVPAKDRLRSALRIKKTGSVIAGMTDYLLLAGHRT